MHPKFEHAVAALSNSFEKLLSMEPVMGGKFPATTPLQGVYLFTENARHLYVGRSNGIRRRYGRHCNPGVTHRMAAFAFRLAREATGRVRASYRSDDQSRTGLIRDPVFAEAFENAKTRIRAMNFRYVEECDQTRQALLEIYCAVVLVTPYNDFNTH
jgi:hypothetical protein